MALTQDSVLSLLITEGGKVKKNDFVGKSKGLLDSDDPEQKKRNRELFKTFVNNVATVIESDGVKYVVVNKKYRHLLDGGRTVEKMDGEEESTTGERQRSPTRRECTDSCDAAGRERADVPEPEQEQENNENDENPTELSLIQMALRRSKGSSGRVRKMLNFNIQEQGAPGDNCPRWGAEDEPTKVQNKPFALPLRMPPSNFKVKLNDTKENQDVTPGSPISDTFKSKRRPPPLETHGSISSPQLRRAARNASKVSEEPKETRVPSSVPLEHSEHEWLVKCAAGHWSQAYGLLLRDSQLAEKRDFISGFTALHWAAKCGNSEMLVKIIDLSKQGGVDLDVNAKTHGGYTPLHIAALHDQEYIITMLVGEFGADPSVRDNCGKKAYHYLHKGISTSVREMLGEPKAQQVQDRALHEKEELDLFLDLSKGLHTISRLFQPHTTGHRKKHKQRSAFYSLSEDPGEEREDNGFRSRTISDAFM